MESFSTWQYDSDGWESGLSSEQSWGKWLKYQFITSDAIKLEDVWKKAMSTILRSKLVMSHNKRLLCILYTPYSLCCRISEHSTKTSFADAS